MVLSEVLTFICPWLNSMLLSLEIIHMSSQPNQLHAAVALEFLVLLKRRRVHALFW
jgi:hypothetical protein